MQVMERVLQQKGDTHFDFLALAAADVDERTRAGLLDGFQRLLERYPDNQQLLFGQALLLYQDGRNEEALQQLQRLPQASQASAILLQRARLLQDLGRHEQALKRLRQALASTRPTSACAWPKHACCCNRKTCRLARHLPNCCSASPRMMTCACRWR